MSVNKAILIGRLGKDPEMKYTSSGKAVCNFSLATTERFKGQDGQQKESTTWHNIVVWGKPAEIIKEYMSKGREIYLEGRISNRSYDDKDGNKKYTSEVVVQNFQFIGSKGETSNQPEAPPSQGAPDSDLPF